jgi:antitoxin (DNA-binding transcriptional repressor) of toxin-antitoxin stability system
VTTVYEYNAPPIKAAAFTFHVALVSQADTDIFKTSPTLAAGDIMVSKDGGNFANIATLPTQIQSTGVLPVALSASEMDANIVTVKFVDAAGAEWQDALVIIRTVAAVTVAAAADVWDYTTRTLTQTAAEVAAVVAGSSITITRGDTLSAALTGLASNTGYVSIDFTVKYDQCDSDDDAILRIRKNASGTGDGLLRLNGVALVSPVVAADGSITVNSATALTIALAARAADVLPAVEGCYYDIQVIFAASVQTITEGVCNISADVTRAIS